jgi:1,4-dihydroxy-2-naphthoate octaprenyltransferase
MTLIIHLSERQELIYIKCHFSGASARTPALAHGIDALLAAATLVLAAHAGAKSDAAVGKRTLVVRLGARPAAIMSA